VLVEEGKGELSEEKDFDVVGDENSKSLRKDADSRIEKNLV